MRSCKRRGSLVVLILLSFSSCILAARAPAKQDTPHPRIDYVARLNELVQKGSDESLNADPCYREACTLCDRAVPYVDVWSWPTDWSRAQRSSVKDWVKANAGALVQLRLGAQRPFYWFQFQGRSIWEMDRVSYLANVRLLVFALTFQTKLEATEGNAERAIEAVLAGCRFALDVKRRLLLMEQFVGMAASNYPLDTGFQILGRCTLDPSLLKRLQERLTELAKDTMWSINLDGEELATLEAIQEVCAHVQASRDKGDMIVINKVLAQLWTKQKGDSGIELTAEQVYSSVRSRTPEELAGLVRKGYAYFDTLVSKTPFQWKKEGIDPDQKWRELVDGNELLVVLAPPVARASELSFRFRASRDALITTLALLRHKHDKAAFPADLQELVSAGYTVQLPMDPYSDKPLVYKRTENNFVLYSLGADFQDSGGKRDRRWGEGERGADYVFWPIRME